MRIPATPDGALPKPGTAEAIALGCTCAVIAHDSKTDELEPSGMLAAPDANCPVHGAAAQLEEHD
ncbi:hypothetical protein Q3C01_25445 [Bradyrhizobium sp. UFLA05-109]